MTAVLKFEYHEKLCKYPSARLNLKKKIQCYFQQLLQIQYLANRSNTLIFFKLPIVENAQIQIKMYWGGQGGNFDLMTRNL